MAVTGSLRSCYSAAVAVLSTATRSTPQQGAASSKMTWEDESQSNTTVIVVEDKEKKPTSNMLTIHDHRTHQDYAINVNNNAILATDLKQITVPAHLSLPQDQPEQGLRVLDQGFRNTACMESKITFVDGLRGTLQYRGHSVFDLCDSRRYEEVAHLLIFGHLPSAEEQNIFTRAVTAAKLPSDHIFEVIKSFPPTASPTAIIITATAAQIAADDTKIPAVSGDPIYMNNIENVDRDLPEVLSTVLVIIAAVFCHCTGREFTKPDPEGSILSNFLLMMGIVDSDTKKPDPRVVDILNCLWILTAEHEINCSTASLLHTASSITDPYSCLVASVTSGYGILHGGAIDIAYKQLQLIPSVEDVPASIEFVKATKTRLFGFGHKKYKVTDPRSVRVRELIDKLEEIVPSAKENRTLQIAREVDRVASTDEYFTSRNLCANTDLYVSFVYTALGIPPAHVLSMIMAARIAGMLAHWREAMGQKVSLWRPQQIYTGTLGTSS